MKFDKLMLIIGIHFSSGAMAINGIHIEDEFYVGGKVGATKLNITCSNGYSSCDDDDLGAGLYAGYQIKNWLAVEGGYNYLGSFDATYLSQNKLDATIQDIDLGIKADYGLTEKLALYGKVGSAYSIINKSIKNGSTQYSEEKESDFALLLATGLDYRLNRNWNTRLSYEYVNNIDRDTDLHFLNLGIDYRFGNSAPQRELEPTPTPPPPVVVEPKQPQVVEHFTQELSSYSNDSLFESNSANLTFSLREQLRPMLKRLRAYPTSTVEITGYTDSTGASNYNQRLSEQRAKAVAQFFIQEGIDTSRITTRGYGELFPISSNDTESGRARNRRVELNSPKLTIKK